MVIVLNPNANPKVLATQLTLFPFSHALSQLLCVSRLSASLSQCL